MISSILAALAGPAISWVSAVLFIVNDGPVAQGISDVLQNAAILIWPFMLAGALDNAVGSITAELLLVGLNVGMYLGIGYVASHLVRSGRNIALLYLLLVAPMACLALWIAGFELANLDMWSAVIALLIVVSFIESVRREVTPDSSNSAGTSAS